jgi:hypothetical protein
MIAPAHSSQKRRFPPRAGLTLHCSEANTSPDSRWAFLVAFDSMANARRYLGSGAKVGLGRIVALHCRASASCQIH